MNPKRIFLSVFLLIAIISGVTSLLVPQGLNPNVIEDLESNYHSVKNLYEKAVQLKDLLSKEDFSSVSIFLENLKDYIGDYKSQESRSGLLLQKISIKFKHMESGLDPNDRILNEKLLKDQAEDLRKLTQELETKIDGIKADPMMFTKEKADDLSQLIQFFKEKFSLGPNPSEDSYAAHEAKEAKKKQVDQLEHQKRTLEAQVKRVKSDKESKDFLLGKSENEIRELNKKVEEVKRQIEQLEKPNPQTSFSGSENLTSNQVFHFVFLVDASIREEESQKILEQADSNIGAIRAARKSEKDVYSLIAFDKEAHVLAERLPMSAKHGLQDFKPKSYFNDFENGLKKAGKFVKNSKEEVPVVILYTDGMRSYWEAQPFSEEEEKSEGFWNWLVDLAKRIYRYLWKKWFLKTIKESEILEIKRQLADFNDKFVDRDLTCFISGTTSQNREILREFAKSLNRNEIAFQTTIGENYDYLNLARETEIFPQIFRTLSIAEKGPVSTAYLREQAIKKVQKDTEEIDKNIGKNKLLEEKNDLDKKLNESLRKKDQIEFEIKSFSIELEKLQSEISSIESSMTSLIEEIRVANEKNFERERAMKEREKLETKYAEIKSHLEILEQLTKTVQARDHNILAIFEHVTTYCKDFLKNLERALRKSEGSNFDLLIAFYKDQLGLYGTDLDNMEKICQFWFEEGSDKAIAKDFFMMINPRDLINNDLEIRRVGFESLDQLKGEYQEFYWSLKRKVSTHKMDQRFKIMNSRKSEIKSFFSQDMKKLMEKLNGRIYMMY